MLLIVFGEGSVDELLWELALGALFFSDWSCGFVFGERLGIKGLLVGVFLGEDLTDGSDLIATLLQTSRTSLKLAASSPKLSLTMRRRMTPIRGM